MTQMKIEYQQGDDWARLIVDGEMFAENHRLRADVFLRLLKELGAIVDEPQGDFCDCGHFGRLLDGVCDICHLEKWAREAQA
jgi:hypothetical protein